MKSPLAKALMTTSAKHIWTATANRRELAKAIFFFNQIVFLIMFLFLPKLLIRHLEDFLLRGKCNKLVCFPASLPWALVAARPARAQGVCPGLGSPGCPRTEGCATLPVGMGMCCYCCSVPGATTSTQQSQGHRHRTPTSLGRTTAPGFGIPGFTEWVPQGFFFLSTRRGMVIALRRGAN